uniref:Uncharacterized protein n=1 Tax=Aegilops tauschii TaxID=37682 RepID=R7WF18_AEGTA
MEYKGGEQVAMLVSYSTNGHAMVAGETWLLVEWKRSEAAFDGVGWRSRKEGKRSRHSGAHDLQWRG